MKMLKPDDIQWLDPWHPLSPVEARPFEEELEREMNQRHPLFGMKARAIGRRDDRDDVLFELEGAPPQVAVVHLTRKGAKEKDPRWPHTVIFDSLKAWVEQEMRLDHDGDEAVI